MGNIQLHGTRDLLREPSRQVARQLTRLDDRTELAVARVQAVGIVQAAKIDVLNGVTQRAMQAATFVSQVEQQLAQTVPLSASRLQAIGDVGTLGTTQLLMDTATALRGL